jgi:hypothetical protein
MCCATQSSEIAFFLVAQSVGNLFSDDFFSQIINIFSSYTGCGVRASLQTRSRVS